MTYFATCDHGLLGVQRRVDGRNVPVVEIVTPLLFLEVQQNGLFPVAERTAVDC